MRLTWLLSKDEESIVPLVEHFEEELFFVDIHIWATHTRGHVYTLMHL